MDASLEEVGRDSTLEEVGRDKQVGIEGVGVELSGEEDEDWNEEDRDWDWESIVYTRLVASV